MFTAFKHLPFPPADRLKGIDDNARKTLQVEMTAYDDLIKDAKDKVKKIKLDPGLNDIGKAQQVQVEMDWFKGSMDKISKAGGDYRAYADLARRDLMKPKESTTARDCQRDKEIRDYLVAMNDAGKVNDTLNSAIEHQQDDFLRAALDDPIPNRLVKNEQRADLEQARMRLFNPRTFERIEELSLAEGYKEGLMAAVKGELRKLGLRDEREKMDTVVTDPAKGTTKLFTVDRATGAVTPSKTGAA